MFLVGQGPSPGPGRLVWEVEGHWLSSGSQELALSWEAWAVMGRKPLWGRWQEEVL